jgi:ferric-dicitrate binding protein FerR (iron transport regulator)
MATIYPRGNSVQVSLFDEEEVTGWKDGILFMERVNFEKAVIQLERWYGVTFKIAQKESIDPQWRFSGKFQNRSLEYVLDALRYPELFEFEIDDKTVTIK